MPSAVAVLRRGPVSGTLGAMNARSVTLLTTLIVVVAAIGVLAFIGGIQIWEGSTLEYSALSIRFILVSGLVATLIVLLRWFVPRGRSPSQIPDWNNIHHAPIARAGRGILQAAGLGGVAAAWAWVATNGLITFSIASSQQVETVKLLSKDGHTKHCMVLYEVTYRQHAKLICACPGLECLPGHRTDLTPGDSVRIKVQSNPFGSMAIAFADSHGA